MAGLQKNPPRFTGPAYPFTPGPQGTLGPKPDVQVIVTSMMNILTTPKGTIPYNPELGSQLPYLLFEINDEITRQLIRYFVVKDLAEQEPRAVIQNVFTEQPDDQSITVQLAFSLVGDPAARVYSAPLIFPRGN